MKQDYPCWRYGAGNEGETHDGKAAFEHNGQWIFKQLCKSADDVPAGWVDSPEKIVAAPPADPPKRRGRPPKVKPEDEAAEPESSDE